MKRLVAALAAATVILGVALLPIADAAPQRPHAASWSAGDATSVKVTTLAVAAGRQLRPGARLTVGRVFRQRRVRSVRWLRCDLRGRTCRVIRGAAGRSYVVRLADVGHTLRARVTVQGSVTATTVPTVQVGRPLPVNTVLPAITDGGQGGGTLAAPLVGDSLTGSTGGWQHAVRFTFQWEDCDAAGANCVPILGATSQAYTLQDSDVGDTIVFQVTAYNF